MTIKHTNINQGPLYKRVGGRVIPVIEKLIGKASKIGDRAVFPTDTFPWAHDLEDHWQDIRDEVTELLRIREQIPNFQDISTDQKSLTSDNKWKTFFLCGYGPWSELGKKMCPKTVALIKDIPGLRMAFFSILAPGKTIPPHRGFFKGVVRYHLGLVVPEPRDQCQIRVHDQVMSWQEGKSLIFDDTYEHEVWNRTDGQRVVLFMDIERPMFFPFSLVNKAVIKLVTWSPFIKNPQKNQIAWEKNFLADLKKQESPQQKVS